MRRQRKRPDSAPDQLSTSASGIHLKSSMRAWSSSFSTRFLLICAAVSIGGCINRSESSVLGPQDSRIEFFPSSARIVRGTVIDSLGESIVDAQVQLVSWAGEAQIFGQCQTSSEGGFVILASDNDDFQSALLISAAGFSPTVVYGIDPYVGDLSVGSIVLLPPAQLAGHVCNAQGSSVPDAQVFVTWEFKHGERSGVSWATRIPCDATTDGDGNYTINGLPSGPIVLGCESRGYADVKNDITCLRPGVNRVDIRLEPSVPVHGIVHDSRGHPAAKATITPLIASHRNNFWGPSEYTNVAGEFELHGIAAISSETELRIDFPRHRVAFVGVAGLAVGTPINLEPATVVAFTARYSGSDVLPLIDYVAESSDSFNGLFHLESTEPGRSAGTLSSFLDSGDDAVLTAVTHDHLVAPAVKIKAPSPIAHEVHVDVTFPAYGEIVGSIKSDSGAAICGARAEFQSTLGWAPRVAFADSTGSFRFRQVVPSSGLIRCRGERWVSDPASISVESGSSTDVGSIIAKVGCEITGNVCIDRAPPRRSIPVAAYSFAPECDTWKLHPSACVATDSDGCFKFSGLSPGTYAICVRSDALGAPPSISASRIPLPWNPGARPDQSWRKNWRWTVQASTAKRNRIDISIDSTSMPPNADK
jgi:hypothetical protein